MIICDVKILVVNTICVQWGNNIKSLIWGLLIFLLDLLRVLDYCFLKEASVTVKCEMTPVLLIWHGSSKQNFLACTFCFANKYQATNTFFDSSFFQSEYVCVQIIERPKDIVMRISCCLHWRTMYKVKRSIMVHKLMILV